MEYKVVEEINPEKMSESVDELLKDGWALHGNLILVAYYNPGGRNDAERNVTIYAQAMTKGAKTKSGTAAGGTRRKQASQTE